MSRNRRGPAPGATFFFRLTLADREATTLTDRIDVLRASYSAAAVLSPFETIAICVLPEHLHALRELPAGDNNFSLRWSYIKRAFSRGLPSAPDRSTSKSAKREKGMWQRRFWEHRIRDVNDLQRHLDYIHYKPVKHGLVSRVADWPYSSVHRYVRDG